MDETQIEVEVVKVELTKAEIRVEKLKQINASNAATAFRASWLSRAFQEGGIERDEKAALLREIMMAHKLRMA